MASPTGAKVRVTNNAFANLMESPIPQTAVVGTNGNPGGGGTADLYLIVNTAMSVPNVGAGVLFATAYGRTVLAVSER